MRRAALIVFACVLAGCSSSSASSGPDAADAQADGQVGGGDASLPDAAVSPDGAPSADGPTDAGPKAPLHFIGRFDTSDAKGPRFAWPGSAITTRFSGTGATLKVHDQGTNFFDVSIDGAPPTVLTTTSASDTYVIAAGLADAEHGVSIVKRTESDIGVVQFFDVVSKEGRALVPTPAPFARRMELIGDSITCGYGVLGTTATCNFSADTEDEELAYGGLAAAALSAAHTAIAYSGIGVYRNYDGQTSGVMPERWKLTLADDAASAWDFHVIPDVVVINLGTNDFAKGDPGQPFQSAYEAFMKAVRAKYANAAIVGALSPMLSDSYPTGASHRSKARAYIQAAIDARKSAGDAKVSFFEFDEQNAGDGYGCDYHPSQATQKKMADKLVPAIRAIAGW